MKKKPDEKLKEFSKILTKIGEDIKPSAEFRNHLKNRLLAKLERQEAKQTFWQRVIKPLVLKPSFQAVFASLLIIFVVTTLLVRDFNLNPQNKYKEENIKQFSSVEEYRNYLQSSLFLEPYMGEGYAVFSSSVRYRKGPEPLLRMEKPSRVSSTNVQVKGIDEGDILKTDGQNIYLSDEKTKIIKAFPLKNLSILGKIDKSGDLLLQDNTLVIFSEKAIYGFDVSNAKQPQEKWTIKIEKGTRLTDTRMKDGKIYFVTNTSISPAKAVNRFLKVDDKPIDIAYSDIYYPGITINADSTYTVSALNPNTGNIEDKVSFVGSSNDSVVYMSNNSIYLTYSYTEETIDEMADFLEKEAKNEVELTKALRRLASYDLSTRTKEMEMSTIFESYSSDSKMEKKISRLITKFYKEKSREIEKTGIVKIGIPSLDIEASGKVAGHPLNQFALDEYQGNLRIATTVGEQFYSLDWLASDMPESANDVYVLDKNLETRSSIKNLGLTERIYSARFINDKAYIVTFRETDPFYVLDLSNSSKPSLKGELKIPGYSSYLQPITEDKVLGVGKEGQKVKAQLFDVSSPSKPKALSKLVLNEYWSEALTNHHAFLLDDKYEVFFIPGEEAGYVVTYKNNKLSLKKAIAGISAKRALYLNDYLYIVGNKQITVVEENTWKKVNQLVIN